MCNRSTSHCSTRILCLNHIICIFTAFLHSLTQTFIQCLSENSSSKKEPSLVLGVTAMASLNAVEVEAGVLTLEMRIEELSFWEGGKIMSKDNS